MQANVWQFKWIIVFCSMAIAMTLGSVQSVMAQSSQGVFMPLVIGEQSEDDLFSAGSVCAEGYYLTKLDGTIGIEHIEPFGVDPDQGESENAGPNTYNNDEYRCVPNQKLEDISCVNGTAVIDGGVAACACEQGYGGATCNMCAQGYEANEAGACVLSEKPELVVDGATASMVPGETRTITPTAPGLSVFQFRVAPEMGCFEAVDGSCSQEIVGGSVNFRASRTITELVPITIKVAGGGVGSVPPYEWEINTLAMPADRIPVAGYGDSRLMPIIKHLSTYMQHRCIGAATVGISRNGVVLGTWSLGRVEGPAASDMVWDEDCQDPMLVVGDLADPVAWDAPFLIGSNTKFHTSAILRWALKQVAKQEGGLDLTDEQILGLRPFDPNNYPPVIPGTNPPVKFPVPIVPLEVYRVMSGLEPYPAAAIPDSTSFGDTSVQYPLCNGSSVANGFADAQWQNVTIEHIISHRTGLQRSAPTYGANVVASLPAIRGLSTQADYAAQEAILRAQFGDTAVNSGKAGLGYPNGTQTYILPKPTLDELMLVIAGRCLRYPLGVYSYSNTSPSFSTLIIRELVASGNLSAPSGNPAAHETSALSIFLQQTIGLDTAADDGIFNVQQAVDVADYIWRGAEFRSWSAAQNTYYPTDWDLKQPHCVWNGSNSTCSITDWRNATNGRINWNMSNGPIPFLMAGGTFDTGTGSFAVEARDELKMLANYRIGSYNDPITVGQPRAGLPNGNYSHNGSLGGGHSFVRQISFNTAESMTLPPLDENGNLLDDYINLMGFSCPKQLPDGVDYIVSVNQNNDAKCTGQIDPTDPTQNNCSRAYAVLDAVVRYGICQVNWAVVPTVNGFAIAE